MGHDTHKQAFRFPPLPLLQNERVIEEEPDQRPLTKRYTEEALSFIKANRTGPFFLDLAHTMPRWPQYASERFVGKSRNDRRGDAGEELDWYHRPDHGQTRRTWNR